MDAAICLMIAVILTAGETLNADQCVSNPCSNGGTCYNEYEGYGCLCPAGYSGPRCEQRQNSGGRLGFCPDITNDRVGLCVEDCTDDSSCPAPLKCCSNGCGHVCTAPVITEDMNWCMSNPCGNGGTCVYNRHGYGCLCDAGRFVGSHCEVPVLQSPSPSSSSSFPSSLSTPSTPSISPSPPATSSISPPSSSLSSSSTLPGDDNPGSPEDVAGNQQLPTAIIIAAVCSVIIIVAILVLTGIFLYRRRNQTTDSDTVSVDSGKQIIKKGPETGQEPCYMEHGHQMA
ncbi:delta-like protein 3 [Patiria miniata]|uniref:Uncharacterized protein n=1 Tax=Patiria miniata TaxID=46514 RepID=A0A914AKR0_PATMI|nr:delta-like protein 3 [Patiria miniata]XP_038064590.1 delta-like protein 3 [Patiria miniata]XP_038064591.1 delta-like protein 3 [Patiria miniata]